jgi:transposase
MDTTTQSTRGEVPDDVWTMVEPVLKECYPAKPKGHRRVGLRRVRNGVIFRLRTDWQGHTRPACFGDDRTVHCHVQPWCQRGLFAPMWAVLVEAWEVWGGVDWPWQAADAAMGKARMGGARVGRNPTDRGNQGGHAVCWWTRLVDREAWPWRGPTSTIRSSWPPRWRPSWWCAPSQLRKRHSLCAWTRAMTIPQALNPWPPSRISRISAAWARKRSMHTGRRPLLRDDGASNGHWHGCRNGGASSCAMKGTPSLSWVCCHWPGPCCGCGDGRDSCVMEIVS